MTQSPSDSFRFACPKCGNRLRAVASQVGTNCDCPKCGARLRVPEPGKSSPAGADQTSRGQSPTAKEGERDSHSSHEKQPSLQPGGRQRESQHSEAEPQYVGFPCEHCETRLHALISQVGQHIECPDCGVMAIVPPPAPPKPKNIYAPAFEDIEAYEVDESGEQTDSGSPETDASFSYLCLVCESLLSATLSQVGQIRACPDCGHRQKIQKPKVTPKPTRPPAMDEEERDPYEISAPVETLPADRFVDLGEEDHEKYVQRAREMGLRGGHYERPILPKTPFISGVYSFPFAQGVWPRWVMLYFFAFVAVAMLSLAGQFMQGAASTMWLFGLVMVATGTVATVLFILVLSPHLLAIYRGTAAGSDDIDWPEMDFTDWITDVFYLVYSLALSGLPSWLMVWLLGSLGYTPEWRGLVVFGFAFLLHPLTFLTITGAASQVVPYAPDVWRGMALATKRVFSFYVNLLILYVAIAVVTVILVVSSLDLFGYVFPGIVVAVAMIYFRLVGRLALCCSEAVYRADKAASDRAAAEEGERPKKDAIDRAREAAMH